ncbi:MAG: hypothetical protein ACLUEV_10170 [Alistipes sp.]
MRRDTSLQENNWLIRKRSARVRTSCGTPELASTSTTRWNTSARSTNC